MKIYFKPEGGFGFFPGLNKPLELNSEQLSPEEASHLQQLIQEASFFDLPEQQPEAKQGADQKKYTIRVEDKDQQHWIELHYATINPQLQNLLSYLHQKQREVRV